MKYPEPYTEKDIQEAEENGIDFKNFYNRVVVLKWTVERAKTQVLIKRKRWHGNYPKRANENGITSTMFYDRVNNKGWHPEDACTIPPLTKEEVIERRRQKLLNRSKYGGYLKRARENGIARGTFNQRVLKGWSLEKASSVPVMNKSECARYAYRVAFQKKYSADYDECLKVAESNGIGANALNQRLNSNWDLERAITTPLQCRKKRGEKQLCTI